MWWIVEINRKGRTDIISSDDINWFCRHKVEVEIKGGPFHNFSQAVESDLKNKNT